METETPQPDDDSGLHRVVTLEHRTAKRAGETPYKWIAGSLAGVVMFMLGGFVQHLVTQQRIDEHERMDAHPIMQERFSTFREDLAKDFTGFQEDLDEIKADVKEMREELRK